MVSINAGFTTDEIRDFVQDYQLQPYGTKKAWLAERGVPYTLLRRWRLTVYEGDLDRGLIPRHGGVVSVPSEKLTALERQRAHEQAAHKAEVEELHARIRQLEETSSALGKAIGLLHAMRDQEPDAAPTTTDPSDS